MAIELAQRRREWPAAARRIARNLAGTVVGSLGHTIPGPYTSILVEDPGAGAWRWPVSEAGALSISAFYRGLAIYADLIGTMPVQRLRGTEKLDPPAFVAAPAGDPVGWTDEVGQMLWALMMRGNAYALATAYDWQGYPSAFVVLNPDRIEVELREDGATVYRWESNGAGDVELVNPPPDVLLHVRWQRPPGSPVGVGVLDTAGAYGGSLGGVIAAERFAGATMANPIPPAVLTHPLRLRKDQAEELQGAWTRSVRDGAPAVLSGGVTYQPLQVTPRDVQLIESRRWNATQVAVLLGLPPYMLGGSTGDSLTYSTVEGEMIRLWTTALMPASVRLERAFGAWTPSGQRLRFVPDALLRSQTLDRYNAHKIAIEAGFATVDEIRDLENRPPMPTTEDPANE